METLELSLLLGAALVILSIVVSPLANRFGAPILLVFLAIGMLVGRLEIFSVLVGYIGYRFGIIDGTWVYFVAGD